MARLKFGSGSIRIEMDDTLDRLARAAIERVAPGVLDQVEAATRSVFDDAVAAWPVRTGRSRDGLEVHTVVDAGGERIRGTITNDVDYSRYIRAKRLGGRSAVVELLRKPLRERARALVEVLTETTRNALEGA